MVDRLRDALPPQHRELAKFAVVGGTSWVIDTGIFTLLSHTVLDNKVITSKIISVLVSTAFNYFLNREWSFKERGGRERHHEMMLFILVSAIALGVNLLPLWVSHYLFGFNLTHHSKLLVEITDFVAANIVGTIMAMAFRYWAFRRFVFPDGIDKSESPESGHGSDHTSQVSGPV